MAGPIKRARLDLTLHEKIQLIKDYEASPGTKKKDLAKKYHIGNSTVGDILRRKDVFLSQFQLNIHVDSNKHRFGGAFKFKELNDAMYKWYCIASEKGLPTSGPIIQEKAVKYATVNGMPDFKASGGWLSSWKSRFSIRERKSSNQNNCYFHDRLSFFWKNFPPCDVFNCDETGLLFRTLPDASYSTKLNQCKEGKMPKERLTILLACSATGERLKPLVIGQYETPKCFRNDEASLPIMYFSNENAWLTEDLFMDWLCNINTMMKKQRRSIVMFLDNAISHVNQVSLSNVKMCFLPPKTNSILQPLEQGIVHAFKESYRQLFMTSLLETVDEEHSAQEMCKKIYVLKALNWISLAWDSVCKSTIVQCFQKAKFFSNSGTTFVLQIDPDSSEEEVVSVSQLARQLKITYDPHFDDNIPTEDNFSSWEERIFNSKSDISSPKAVCESNFEPAEPPLNAEQSLSILQDVLCRTTSTSIIVPLRNLISDLEAELLNQNCPTKTPKIEIIYD